MSRDIAVKRNTTSDQPAWWQLASVRWNFGGSIACLLVFAAIVYVYRFGAINQSLTVLPGVGAEEAIELLRHADTWQQLHDETRVAYHKKLERVDSLASWIPDTANFDELNRRIGELSEANNAQLILLSHDHTMAGSRVGVMACTCHLRGRFESICRVLDELPKMEYPVICDGILLKPGSDENSVATWCEAIVSLRVPHAADGTLAARLLAQRGSHGH